LAETGLLPRDLDVAADAALIICLGRHAWAAFASAKPKAIAWTLSSTSVA
jgi:uracil-DNA glycosylase